MKQYNFDPMIEFCISQGSAATFFMFGGQMYNHLCQIYSGFPYQKWLKSVHF